MLHNNKLCIAYFLYKLLLTCLVGWSQKLMPATEEFEIFMGHSAV